MLILFICILAVSLLYIMQTCIGIQSGVVRPCSIKKIEKQFPKTMRLFKHIQDMQYELFAHKQHDYGSQNISVGTRLDSEEEVQLSLYGLWFRMHDKIQRAKNLIMRKESAVDGEPLEDSFLDLSNYGIMSVLVSLKIWGK